MAIDGDLLAIIGTVVTAAVLGISSGLKGKKEPAATETQATVLAGTILSDGKVLKEVIAGIDAHKDELREGREERHRDTARIADALETHARALRDNTEELRQNTIALRNSSTTPEALAMMRRIIGGA